MKDGTVRVTDASSLEKAIAAKATLIEVAGRIENLASVRLAGGTVLRGATPDAALHFKPGQPGLILSANHQVNNLRLETDAAQIALGLADDASDLGKLEICDLQMVGRFHLEASTAKSAQLTLDNIHVERADAALAAHRPAGFGVEVLLGGIAIYNYSKDPASRWILEARNLSGGSREHPLRGSGVFVFGGWYIPSQADLSLAPAPTQPGGTIEVKLLTTGELHSQGGIPPGTPNLISGGVFLGSGAIAHSVVNQGPVTTYQVNDMVLDNWGRIVSWRAQAKIASYGPSGIGFVNFGDIDNLTVEAPIETHGLGARGFNLYDGSLRTAHFQTITTYGDGAIAVQLSKPFGTIVASELRTKGGAGESLVRGKLVHLRAHALSLKPGAQGEEILVKGQALAENQAIPVYDFEAEPGAVKRITVAGARVSA